MGEAREGSNDRFEESQAMPLGRQTNRQKYNKKIKPWIADLARESCK